jgi:dihydrolipoamide dehydrogenase
MEEGKSQFDLVVIGGGPGGYGAALYGAAAGLDVAIVEMDKLGGTCLHVGCIPAKELLETASVLRTVREAEAFGIKTSSPELDMSQLMARKQGVIDQLAGGVEGLLHRRKVTVYKGIGQLGKNKTVRITGQNEETQTITGTNIILASGSKPRTIPGFDIDGKLIVTSDQLLSITKIPSRVVIIGGGAIGAEFASALNDFGSTVTIVEALPQILTGCDVDLAKVVERAFRKRGIDIRTGILVQGHDPQGEETIVRLEDGETIEADMVVLCVGRRPFSDLLGLEQAGIKVSDDGFVPVDAFCETTDTGTYAIGDLVNTPQLAHVAFAEAIMAIKRICGETASPVDYKKVPWAIYCHPEVAFAGLSESDAIEAGYEVAVSKNRYSGNGRAMIVGETDGLVKVVAEKLPDGSLGQILGVHMAGPWVTEQIGQGYLAVNWEATVGEVAEFIQPHPTLSELFGETVMSLTGRALHG